MTDFDRLADKAHPNPYESAGDTVETIEPCEKCGKALKILRWEDGEIDEAESEICAWHLRLVCGWCKKAIGYRSCDEDNDGQISHGICVPCAGLFVSRMDE